MPAKAKTPKMRDGIIQRAPGKYSYIVRETDPETGAKRTRWVSGFPTREAAKAARDTARADIRKGVYVSPSQKTVKAWLNEWLELVTTDPERALKPTTVAGYRWIADKYLIPELGSIPLQALKPSRLKRYWISLAACGGRNGGKLSARTVDYARGLLRAALEDAVDDDLIAKNPERKSRRRRGGHAEPAIEPKPIPAWDAKQQQAFIEATARSRWNIVWRLALGTGLRRGELCALRWDCIDLEAGTITVLRNAPQVGYAVVEGTPKSQDSIRTVPIGPDLTMALGVWSVEQGAESDRYAENYTNNDGLVITWPDGRRVMPEYLTKQFAKEQESCNLKLPRLRLHDTRHSYVSLHRSNGTPAATIQALVGHADTRMTDHYTHAFPADVAAAVARVSSVQGF
jgi:integrase